MSVLTTVLQSELNALPHGPWATRTFGLDTVEPTTVVMAGERPVCVLTAPRSEAVGRIVARLPDLLTEAREHARELAAHARKTEAVTDERDDLKDEVAMLKDELRICEQSLKESRAENDRLFAQLADLRGSR